MTIRSTAISVVFRANYFQKKVGAQYHKRPNRDKIFKITKITAKDSICSKQVKLKKKICKEISFCAKLQTIISRCL